MKQLPTSSYRGSKDYLPSEKRLQNYIFTKWHKVAQSFGYQEYATPLIEPLELYLAKSGEELASQQTYVFEDRGGRTVAIRPEMTPSIARLVASQRQSLPMPARLYSIANFMRYERPQKGREREFWQMNVDIFGVASIVADAEIIDLAHASIMEFGADQEMFVVRISHRQLIRQLMSDFLSLNEDDSLRVIKLIDKKAKLPEDVFIQQLQLIFGDDNDKMTKLQQILEIKTLEDLTEITGQNQYIEEVSQLLLTLKNYGISNAQFDITLMRGLDYYTGIVFEFFDNHPENNRALFGGGRYDGLVGLFGVEDLPTVGVGMGATTMFNFLQDHDLLPKLSAAIDFYIAPVEPQFLDNASQTAQELRRAGFNVELDISGRKLKQQIKTADKKGIEKMIFIGEEEVKTNQLTIKNIATGQTETTTIDQLT